MAAASLHEGAAHHAYDSDMAEELGKEAVSGSERLEELAIRWSVLERQGLTNGPQGVRLRVLTDLVEDCLETAAIDPAPSGETVRRAQIVQVADEYGSDAQRYGRLAVVQYSLAVLFTVLAIAAAGTVLTLSASEVQLDSQLLSRFAVAGLLVIVSLPFWFLGSKYRKSASESRRLELQFRAFEPYLKGFVQEADVMRAALAPRLFSRILEDEDPMREPAWPKLNHPSS